MNITKQERDKLRELAQAATPQNLDSAEDSTKPSGYIECPHCGGDGSVELTADYCNYDGVAMGVQFYGIGPEHLAAEAFFRAANPTTILALLDMIDRPAASGDVQANPQASTYPTEIWLQVGGDCDVDECRSFQDIRGSGEITWCEDCIDGMDVHYIRADLATAAPNPAVAAPPMIRDDWQLVPKEPTPEMIAAFAFKGDVDMAIGHGLIFQEACEDYTEMLLAAPTPPSPSLAVRDVVEDQTQRQRVARAIWNLRREDEDRCDMELEDMGDQHSVWEEADAAIAAMPKPNADCSGEPANCPDNEGLGCACDPMNKTAKETSNGN